MTRTRRAQLGDPLTDQELRVLELVAQGLTNAGIGKLLYLSFEAVKSNLRQVFPKLGARDRAHAVAIGYQRGLLGSPTDTDGEQQ